MLLYILCLTLFNWSAHTMTIEVSNIQTGTGQVLIAVYNKSDGFMSEDKAIFKKSYSVSKSGSITVTLPDCKDGDYAISCFHDVNGNGVLDKNLFGVPTAPYGFSQNVRPKFRAPSWEESKFDFNGQQVNIRLDKW